MKTWKQKLSQIHENRCALTYGQVDITHQVSSKSHNGKVDCFRGYPSWVQCAQVLFKKISNYDIFYVLGHYLRGIQKCGILAVMQPHALYFDMFFFLSWTEHQELQSPCAFLRKHSDDSYLLIFKKTRLSRQVIWRVFFSTYHTNYMELITTTFAIITYSTYSHGSKK